MYCNLDSIDNCSKTFVLDDTKISMCLDFLSFKILKMRRMISNSCILFPVTLSSFKSNSCQIPQRALRKPLTYKKKLYLLLYHTSMF